MFRDAWIRNGPRYLVGQDRFSRSGAFNDQVRPRLPNGQNFFSIITPTGQFRRKHNCIGLSNFKICPVIRGCRLLVNLAPIRLQYPHATLVPLECALIGGKVTSSLGVRPPELLVRAKIADRVMDDHISYCTRFGVIPPTKRPLPRAGRIGLIIDHVDVAPMHNCHDDYCVAFACLARADNCSNVFCFCSHA